ncbi:TRF2-interacting telomeric protein/Rap1 C terminal domain-containing protein [Colletotrichum phormii]|uniref:DNA-binding protein RAP1 n=1 Tax=Colletotrichum phormii TaxID=359342 RepID=A0AAI9ZRV3_9PEZI|nr:TRF2-interacting telomeric protein/Rap1 C terminal domain-containing protein [Colletotrichum phormii]KAK1637055.1 TRF2-interacting telomeric protein/Rap1 C terminal domain-containing protein [Colletotrichum phormii]
MSVGGITYDGVPGASGVLFKDLKFFVSLRVPDRVKLLELIKENGGTIAKLETQADHYITFANGPTPAGSLDWKFIRHSVDNGAIQETDKYEMHQTPRASRPVGGFHPAGGSRPAAKANSAPVKGTRTPFSAADDASLSKWVLSHAANKKSGNEIYQVFETINNRHTWHSWRDRWVKKLSKLPPTELEKLAAAAPEMALPLPPAAATSSKRPEATRPAVKKAPPAAQTVSQLPSAKAAAKPRAKSSSATHQPDVKAPLTPAKRTKFTGAEDDLLIREAGRFGGTPDTKFFKKFSEKHSSRSEGAWRRHWTQILEPRLRESSKESLEESGSLPEGPPTVDRKTRPDTASSGKPSRQGESPYDERPNESNGQFTEIPAPEVAPSSASPVRKKDEAKQVLEPRVKEPTAVTREKFYGDLGGYRIHNNLDTQINPEINDQPIDLWRLWQAVGDQYQKGAVEPDWAAVADGLGFHVEDAQLIQQCYADYVAHFATCGILDEPDVESSEDDEVSQPDDENAVPDVPLELLQTQRAATPGASRKRRAITVETSGFPSTPNSRKKRQRLGPDDEIPSTPDEKLGLASFKTLGPSPSLSVKRWTVSEAQVEVAEEMAVEEEEPGQEPAGKPRRLEPETQDFGFDDAFSAPDKSQDSIEFDISPSQQLLGEEESVTPLPLSFKRDKGKGVDRNQSPTPAQVQESPTEEGEEEEGKEEEEKEELDEAPMEAADQAMVDSQESTDKTVELEDLMNRFVSFGYPREDIVLALMATSLCAPLATSLVKYLKEHKDLPNNWQGVWTANDDKRLRRIDAAGSEGGPDGAKIQKYWDYLESKHTRIRIAQRRKFLAYLDETGQSSQ